jgi:hypothetical protein
MKTCVLFAVSIFEKRKLDVLRDYLQALERHFQNASIFVGVNYGTIDEAVRLIITSDLPITYDFVPERLYCGSDASAYQLALKLAKLSNKRYDLFWFVHTKGGVHERNHRKDFYIERFISQRQRVENLFLANPMIGAYGELGISKSADRVTEWHTFNAQESLLSHCQSRYNFKVYFPYRHVHWSYIETFYALSGDIMNTFLTMVDNDYFDNKITDRYYNEIFIPWLSGCYGKLPYVNYPISFMYGDNLIDITKQWIRDNDLDITRYQRLLVYEQEKYAIFYRQF